MAVSVKYSALRNRINDVMRFREYRLNIDRFIQGTLLPIYIHEYLLYALNLAS